MDSDRRAFYIAVQTEDFDLAGEYQQLRELSGNPGAIAIFIGLVREFGTPDGDAGNNQSLTLEHYPGMTEKALHTIVDQAAERWPLKGCRVIHRVGTLSPGDQIVLVAVSSSHREAAFAAAEFVMDYLKTSAPFWKKQQSGSASEWVASKTEDYQRAARWKTPET